MFRSEGALRGTKTRPGPSVRDGPSPTPPVPTASGCASPIDVRGSWQVAHAMSRLPLSSLSKNRSLPRATSAESCSGVAAIGTTPYPPIACRSSASTLAGSVKLWSVATQAPRARTTADDGSRTNRFSMTVLLSMQGQRQGHLVRDRRHAHEVQRRIGCDDEHPGRDVGGGKDTDGSEGLRRPP